jgi:hypothetical protein
MQRIPDAEVARLGYFTHEYSVASEFRTRAKRSTRRELEALLKTKLSAWERREAEHWLSERR